MSYFTWLNTVCFLAHYISTRIKLNIGKYLLLNMMRNCINHWWIYFAVPFTYLWLYVWLFDRFDGGYKSNHCDENQSKKQDLTSNIKQIKSWWKDDGRCNKKSLWSMYISVETCLILMQEIMETRIRNYSNRRSEIQFTGIQITINID